MKRRDCLLLATLVLAVVLVAPATGETELSPEENWTVEETATGNGTEATATTAGTGQTATVDGPTIELDQRLGLVPDRTGSIAVSHQYRVPDQVGLLEVRLPAEASITETRGFVRGEDRTYEWDGRTAQPRLEYRLAVNSTVDRDGPIAGPGRFLFADVGDWAIVRQPGSGHRFGWTGPDRVEFRTTTTAETGATGDAIAFLGEHEEYTHEAHGQRFRLIVPEAATLEPDRSAIFASLADASNRLRVGERDGTVFIVVVPTGTVDWGVRGLQTGPADAWVRDNEPLDDPGNVWLHEYVHTRQGHTASPDSKWVTEASATYYAALLTLQQERISFAQFRDHLAVGERSRFEDAVLTDPGTWDDGANYHVGALVVGELDRRLRTSEGNQTAQELLRRMNGKQGVVDAADFERYLRESGNRSVSDAGARYTRTTDRPAMWTDRQHSEAFAPTTARIVYAFATDPFRVSGPYGDRTPDGQRLVLVPGETLTLDVNATNFGGTAGEYETGLRVDGSDVATRSGRLEAGGSALLSFDHAFETVGTHAVSVGDTQITVDVRDPAAATVESLSVDRSAVHPGETVTLSATVTNDADYPGEATVNFTRDGETVGTERVRLGSSSRETVSMETTLAESGTYVFGVDNASTAAVVVTVTPDEAEQSADEDSEPTTDTGERDGDGTDSVADDPDATPDDNGAGFGVVVVLVALLAVACLDYR